jgi:hypothetical protein
MEISDYFFFSLFNAFCNAARDFLRLVSAAPTADLSSSIFYKNTF